MPATHATKVSRASESKGKSRAQHGMAGVGKGSKTRDPACSSAMSAWKSSGMTPNVAATLGKCRAKARALRQGSMFRHAGKEARAQVEEHRAATGRVGVRNRMLLAQEKIKQRQEKHTNKGTSHGPTLKEQVTTKPAAGPKHEPVNSKIPINKEVRKNLIKEIAAERARTKEVRASKVVSGETPISRTSARAGFKQLHEHITKHQEVGHIKKGTDVHKEADKVVREHAEKLARTRGKLTPSYPDYAEAAAHHMQKIDTQHGSLKEQAAKHRAGKDRAKRIESIKGKLGSEFGKLSSNIKSYEFSAGQKQFINRKHYGPGRSGKWEYERRLRETETSARKLEGSKERQTVIGKRIQKIAEIESSKHVSSKPVSLKEQAATHRATKGTRSERIGKLVTKARETVAAQRDIAKSITGRGKEATKSQVKAWARARLSSIREDALLKAGRQAPSATIERAKAATNKHSNVGHAGPLAGGRETGIHPQSTGVHTRETSNEFKKLADEHHQASKQSMLAAKTMRAGSPDSVKATANSYISEHRRDAFAKLAHGKPVDSVINEYKSGMRSLPHYRSGLITDSHINQDVDMIRQHHRRIAGGGNSPSNLPTSSSTGTKASIPSTKHNVDSVLSKINVSTDGKIDLRKMREKISEHGKIWHEADIPIAGLKGIHDVDVDPSKARIDKGSIVVGKNGEIIDGRHRAARALKDGKTHIRALIPYEHPKSESRTGTHSNPPSHLPTSTYTGMKAPIPKGEVSPALAAARRATDNITATESLSRAASRLRDVPEIATFSDRVQAAADAHIPSGHSGRFGGGKVFISHAHEAYNKEARAKGFPTMNLAEFKDSLIRANSIGKLTLSRADMIEGMNPTSVRMSATRHPMGAEFNFIRTKNEAGHSVPPPRTRPIQESLQRIVTRGQKATMKHGKQSARDLRVRKRVSQAATAALAAEHGQPGHFTALRMKRLAAERARARN